MDVVNLKVSRVGGLTKARQCRDLAVTLGISLTIEDSWGGEIAMAALCHLAHATPSGFHFQSSAFHEYHGLTIASGGPALKDGYMSVSDQPGLGVKPRMEVLGEPVAVVGRAE